MGKLKTEYIDFIRRRTAEGQSVSKIKKELDRLYKQNAPCSRTVSDWVKVFKAAAEGRAFDPDQTTNRQMIDKKYRIFIEKGVNQQKNCLEITSELWNKYGLHSVSRAAIRSWFNRYKAVADAKAMPRPSIQNERFIPVKIEDEEISDEQDAFSDVANTSSYFELNEERLPFKSGFGRGLEIEKILGDVIKNGKRWFMVKWENSIAKDLCEFILYFENLILRS